MIALPLADVLSQGSPIFGILILGGLLVGIYAQAARMPRLLAVAIGAVMLGTVLLIIAAQSADEFQGF